MADISLKWGGDMLDDESGDIASVDGVDELAERCIRRFCTNAFQPETPNLPASPPDYIWNKDYGGNARLYVDRRINSEVLTQIQKRLLYSCSQEVEVSTVTPPVISAIYQNSAVFVGAKVTLQNGMVMLLPLVQVGT